VRSQTVIPGNEPPAIFDRRRINQAIGGVTGERPGQRDGCIGDRGRDADRSNLIGQLFQPEPSRHGEEDPSVFCEPCQFVPGDSANGELVSLVDRGSGDVAQPVRLGAPPLNDVRVEQERRQSYSQVSPVLKRSSSLPTVTARPARLPLSW
jgi:hypothetical protein